ncbi:MAG TPA: TnsD family Tn7-like transposition protein, partial [Clostridia bacterium]|nr:TnsD family Tn7-like transposition protein [Clostridia bacterium]
MLGWFPCIENEELFYSAVARYRYLMRYPNERAILQDVFGSDTISAVVDLPSRLAHFTAQMPSGSPYTPTAIINRHTMLPYYQRFVAPETAGKVRHAMIGNDGGSVHTRLGVMATRVRSPDHLRYCPECVRIDVAQGGFPVWRRAHQLPGVLVCPVHKCVCCESCIPRSNRANRLLFEPLTEEIAAEGHPIPLPDGAYNLMVWLAEASLWLLTTPGPSNTPELLTSRLCTLLTAAGFRRSKRMLQLDRLLQDFQKHVPAHVLHSLDSSLDARNREGQWLARLVHTTKSAQSPLHYLLLLNFLGATPADLFAAPPEQKCDPVQNPRDRWRLDGKPLRVPDEAPCGNYFCRQYSGPARSLLQSMEISPGRHEITCPLCGFIYRWNPEYPRNLAITQTGMMWDEKVRDWLKDPSLSVNQLSKRLDLRILTIQRHARRLGIWRQDWKDKPAAQLRRSNKHQSTLDAHRRAWLDARNAHPDLGRAALSKLAARAYCFLRQYDAQWLDENSPPRRHISTRAKRVDWPDRDIQWTKRARIAVVAMRRLTTKPERICKASIARALKATGVISQHLDQLPNLANFIEDATESPLEFARRRLRYEFSALLRKEGTERLTSSELIRRAALSPQHAAALADEVNA